VDQLNKQINSKHINFEVNPIPEFFSNDVILSKKQKRDLNVLKLLNNLLFNTLGFKGNESAYYDPRNSFINDVLELKLGIPITFSLLYSVICAKIDIQIQMIGMPGHFIVKYENDALEIFIDPFVKGKFMTRNNCIEFLTGNFQHTFEEWHLAAVDNIAVFTRMLRNLMHIYRQNQLSAKLLGILNQIIEIGPDSTQEILARMRIRAQLKEPETFDDLETVKNSLPPEIYQSYYAMLKREMDSNSTQSEEIETPKPRNKHMNVKYQVGKLVTHIRFGYRGVIFGWDPVCKASVEWIIQMGVDRLTNGRNQPFYYVLVDTRDRQYQSTSYVAQENIIIMENPQPIQHTDIGKYFSEYDFTNNCYLLNEELKCIYPNS